MRQETKEAIIKITDCFSGADGGIQFVMLQSLLENMDQKAENGDPAATQIIAIVNQFSRLIDAAVVSGP